VSDALTWARRWARREDATDYELLEVSRGASLEDVRQAYHRLARLAHPDLHRTTLSAAQLEEVTVAFARVGNAYATLSARLRKAAARPMTPPSPPRPTPPAAPPSPAPTPATTPATTRPAPTRAAAPTVPAAASRVSRPALAFAATPAAPTPPAPAQQDAPAATLPIGPANAMSPRALVHYRRAELSLRRGATAEALLHLRLAVATDPHSSFLRRALAELTR
jgi:DnaJ domain